MRLLILATIIAATAAEPDPRILRLVTPETRMVTGIDLERFANTKLAAHFPISFEFLFPNVAAEELNIQRIVTIGVPDEPSLTVIIGAVPPKPTERHERWRAISPEPGVLFIGEVNTVEAALAAWRDSGRKPPEWAERVKEISASYDNWIVVQDPVPDNRRGIAPPPLAHWDALRQSVREFAAGIRLGAQNQCFAAVRLATSEDAIAANALARWLPAFLQKMDAQFAMFVDAARDIQTRQNGTSVELRFVLPDDAIQTASQARFQ